MNKHTIYVVYRIYMNEDLEFSKELIKAFIDEQFAKWDVEHNTLNDKKEETNHYGYDKVSLYVPYITS